MRHLLRIVPELKTKVKVIVMNHQQSVYLEESIFIDIVKHVQDMMDCGLGQGLFSLCIAGLATEVRDGQV